MLPVMSAMQVISALHKAGFVDDQKSPEHLVLWNPITGARTVVPTAKKEKRPLLRAILQDAGLTLRQFLKLV